MSNFFQFLTFPQWRCWVCIFLFMMEGLWRVEFAATRVEFPKLIIHACDFALLFAGFLLEPPDCLKRYEWIDSVQTRHNWKNDGTVGTPYNTNVGVQKIPDRAIWKPVVAKRNNTNPWSCSKPQILVTRDSRQVHMAEQPASHDRLGVNFSLHAFITDCLTTL